MRKGCWFVTVILIAPLAAVELYFSIANNVALYVAKRECATQKQVEIVDRKLWDTAVAASKDLKNPNRRYYAFNFSSSKFDELNHDKFLRPIYRLRDPVRVRGKIVAYVNNTLVYSYGIGGFLMGGAYFQDYDCLMDDKKHSPDYRLIAKFNQFGTD